MHAAVLDLAENGYDLDSLKMSDEDNILIWDQNIDRFLIYTETINQYRPCDRINYKKYQEYYYDEDGSFKLFFNFYQAWKIFKIEDYNNGKLSLDQKFAIYSGEKDTLPSINGNVFEIGLDLGYYTEELTWIENNEYIQFNKEKIIIRGNISDILISDKDVSHYRTISNRLILAFADNEYDISHNIIKSYYEYGNVKKVKKWFICK